MKSALERIANPRPRKISKADALAINRAGHQMLCQEIEELEQRAGRFGLHVTARALNQAKNALGWEMAGDVLAAGKASRGERPHARKRGAVSRS